MAADTFRLLDLPLELLQVVLKHTVPMTGVKEAVKLRLVCKTFDREVPHIMSKVRLLEHQVCQLPKTLRFSVEFTARYIFDRIIVDGKSKNNLAARLLHVMDFLQSDELLSYSKF
ncbi:hypothetical protein H2201_006813 [Coniosporium apollinis]|uniref:F-box domain-containing protein n=1 Tax=Coniosporium apollinis TaxID=61459 RepID=A0ABQ9NNB2_9PEZI|nr:hypothetical protein H2201_006813 [Coniosporium apollinis]